MQHNFVENDILELKKFNKNKIVEWMNFNFKLIFKTIIQKRLRSYNGIPLTWEDIYFEFLYLTPMYLEKFDINKNVPFKTFLGMQCNFFTSNKCRTFSSNKYKVLNTYYSIDQKESFLNLTSQNQVEIPLNTSSLSKLEKSIFQAFFVDELDLDLIAEKLNLSKYKIRKKINLIKLKLLDQVKN